MRRLARCIGVVVRAPIRFVLSSAQGQARLLRQTPTVNLVEVEYSPHPVLRWLGEPQELVTYSQRVILGPGAAVFHGPWVRYTTGEQVDSWLAGQLDKVLLSTNPTNPNNTIVSEDFFNE